MNEPAPPRTILGLPIKPLLVLTVFLVCLLIEVPVNNRTNIIEYLEKHSDLQTGLTGSKSTDIVVTDEMIERARKEIAARQVREQEQSTIDPAGFYVYHIALASGGSLVATDLIIQPDRLILTSTSGIRAEIPRESVTSIRRIPRPADRP